MSERALRISQFEQAVKSGGRYLSRVDEQLGQPELVRERIEQAAAFLRERRLGSEILSVFGDPKSPGLVYVELPEGTREFHGQAAQMLLECCLYEAEGQPNQRAWERWREFGQGIYFGTVEEIYHNFVAVRRESALIFELAYRQLMQQAGQSWWEKQPEEARLKEHQVNRRYSQELTDLLRPLRDKLLGQQSREAEVLELLLDMGSPPDFDPDSPQAKSFASLLRESNLTVGTIAELFRLLYTEQLKADEEALWEKLDRQPFSRPEDITGLVTGSLTQATDLAARELQKVAVRRSAELEVKLNQELAELRKFIARVKKQTQEMVMQNNADMSKAADAKLYSENLTSLSAKVTETLMQFQRNLTGQLWYLQDLERKERNLQSSIERCQSLQRMPPGDFGALLVSGSSEVGTDLLRHQKLHRQLEQSIQGDWEGLTKGLARSLLELIRQGLDNSPAKGRTEQSQADVRALAGLVEEKGGSRAYHVERLIENYGRFLNQVFLPMLNQRRISSLVRLWPPQLMKAPPLLRQQELCDELLYVAERLRPMGRCYSLAAQGAALSGCGLGGQQEAELRELLIRNHSRSVAILAYDVRGSSLLGTRLHNADQEREIRNRLGSQLLQAVRQHGGFMVRDNGDSGVAWFGENAPEIYEKCYKELTTGKGSRIRHSISTGLELKPVPAADAVRQAVECAGEMLRISDRFIQENFSRYREWFPESGDVLYEGINYALLPPAFKSLFRVGVGISAGIPGRNLNLSINPCGDTDLCGEAVNQALQLATARDTSRSAIFLDHPSFAGLLLNAERFSSPALEQLWQSRTLAAEQWEGRLREGMKGCELPAAEGSYFLPGPNCLVRRAGFQIVGLSGPSREAGFRMDASDREVWLQDDGRIKDVQIKAEIKYLYELQIREKGD
jgi:class 3 adenylate cyclase